MVERLAEEFAERFRRGQRPSIREYADRYLEHAQIIREHEYPGVSAGCELTMAVAVETKVRQRFQELTGQWKTQSRYLSNTAQMAMLWPYQQSIGLGAVAVPLILAELRRETDHWF